MTGTPAEERLARRKRNQARRLWLSERACGGSRGLRTWLPYEKWYRARQRAHARQFS